MLKFIKKNWNGEEKLWKVFWIWNFIIYHLLDTLAIFVFITTLFPVQFYWAVKKEPSMNVGYSLEAHDILLFIVGICFILFIVFYTIWIFVSLWRSAFNSSKRIYGYLARMWVVFQIIYIAAIFTTTLFG